MGRTRGPWPSSAPSPVPSGPAPSSASVAPMSSSSSRASSPMMSAPSTGLPLRAPPSPDGAMGARSRRLGWPRPICRSTTRRRCSPLCSLPRGGSSTTSFSTGRPVRGISSTARGPGLVRTAPTPRRPRCSRTSMGPLWMSSRSTSGSGYRLRSKVEIENVTEELTCWQRFGSGLGTSIEEPEAASVGWGSGIDLAGVSSAQGNNSGWHWLKDPRLDSLGFRGIFPADTIPPLVESDKEADESYYLLWRLQRGVAEGSTEIPKGEAIPLEYNLAGLNAISFDKGCYVGQELVARTHHRGVIRKRLLPFRLVNKSGAEVEQEVDSGTDIVDSTSDKKVGAVTTAVGCYGMGLLRLEEAFKSPSLTIKGHEDIKGKVIRPDWWPAEWTQDFELRTAAA